MLEAAINLPGDTLQRSVIISICYAVEWDGRKLRVVWGVRAYGQSAGMLHHRFMSGDLHRLRLSPGGPATNDQVACVGCIGVRVYLTGAPPPRSGATEMTQ